MKNAHLHALILGSSFLISLSIILVRISLARRDSDASTETPAATAREKPSPGAAPAGGEPAAAPADEVEDLLDNAENFYQNAALVDDHEAELMEAQRLLDEASEILDTLPGDDARTRELKIRLSQLRQDVSRASGF